MYQHLATKFFISHHHSHHSDYSRRLVHYLPRQGKTNYLPIYTVTSSLFTAGGGGNSFKNWAPPFEKS